MIKIRHYRTWFYLLCSCLVVMSTTVALSQQTFKQIDYHPSGYSTATSSGSGVWLYAGGHFITRLENGSAVNTDFSVFADTMAYQFGRVKFSGSPDGPFLCIATANYFLYYSDSTWSEVFGQLGLEVTGSALVDAKTALIVYYNSVLQKSGIYASNPTNGDAYLMDLQVLPDPVATHIFRDEICGSIRVIYVSRDSVISKKTINGGKTWAIVSDYGSPVHGLMADGTAWSLLARNNDVRPNAPIDFNTLSFASGCAGPWIEAPSPRIDDAVYMYGRTFLGLRDRTLVVSTDGGGKWREFADTSLQLVHRVVDIERAGDNGAVVLTNGPSFYLAFDDFRLTQLDVPPIHERFATTGVVDFPRSNALVSLHAGYRPVYSPLSNSWGTVLNRGRLIEPAQAIALDSTLLVFDDEYGIVREMDADFQQVRTLLFGAVPYSGATAAAFQYNDSLVVITINGVFVATSSDTLQKMATNWPRSKISADTALLPAPSPAIRCTDGTLLLGTQVGYFSNGVDDFPTVDTNGVMRSTDNGRSWQSSNNGLGKHTFIRWVAKGGKDTLYCAASDIRKNRQDTVQIYRSSDCGKTWTDCSRTVTPLTGATSISTRKNGDILVANAKQLLRSRDHGNTWTSISNLISQTATFYNVVEIQDRLYIATNEGLFEGEQPTDIRQVEPQLHHSCSSLIVSDDVWIDVAATSSSNAEIFSEVGQCVAIVTAQSDGSRRVRIGIPPTLKNGMYTVVCGNAWHSFLLLR